LRDIGREPIDTAGPGSKVFSSVGVRFAPARARAHPLKEGPGMKLLPILSVTLLLGACFGSAQVHFQDTRGGVFVLNGARDKAMEDAHRQMSAHCGLGNYEITQQERVSVGSQTTNSTYATQDEVRDRRSNGRASVNAETGQDRYGSYGSADARHRSREREEAHGQTQGYSNTVTQDVNEFRIHYSCGRGQAVGQAAPAAAPAPAKAAR
jgi:hypothetical protein